MSALTIRVVCALHGRDMYSEHDDSRKDEEIHSLFHVRVKYVPWCMPSTGARKPIAPITEPYPAGVSDSYPTCS